MSQYQVNQPWTSITFSYTPVDGSAVQTVTISAPDFGNKDHLTPTQDLQRMRGGALYAYQRGVKVRTFTFHWPNLNPVERASLEDFFERSSKYSLRWFTMSWAPTQPEKLCAGGSISGVKIGPGQGYYAGQRLIQDTVQLKVRLASPDLNWAESQGGGDGGDGYDGLWDLVLSFERLTTLPANS